MSSADPGEDLWSAAPGTHQIHASLLLTLVAVGVFCVARLVYNKMWKVRTKLSVVVLGGGPVGVTAALVAAKSDRVRKLTIVDMEVRTQMVKRSYQLFFDTNSVAFLQTLGVDFDSIEGCRDEHGFYTGVGIFLEYCLSLLEGSEKEVKILFGQKVSDIYNLFCVLDIYTVEPR